MKLILAIIIFSISSLSFAQRGRPSGLYCDNYVTREGVRGYSIIREYDRADLGNAIFRNLYDCQVSVKAARNGIVCSTYYNRNTQVTSYSIYRVSDLKDLGNRTFSALDSCNKAVSMSIRDTFCAPYSGSNGRSGYSFYSIRSGTDIGTTLFPTLDSCLERL
jgi:hypothetical protein